MKQVILEEFLKTVHLLGSFTYLSNDQTVLESQQSYKSWVFSKTHISLVILQQNNATIGSEKSKSSSEWNADYP